MEVPSHLPLLTAPGGDLTCPNEQFTPKEPCSFKGTPFNECKVLVLGAGGLGCELLKDLALIGFTNIDVIDMDTVDVSNLNRQFLFRAADVGNGKAETAAKFVMERCPGVTVTPHYGKLQDQPIEFYGEFDVVISGLDNIEARRWVNSVLCSLSIDEDGDPNMETLVPLVDGGSEGFKGHARVILPGASACFECSMDLFPPQTAFPICTLAAKPRLPEHCIEWASVIRWGEIRGEEVMDPDNPSHMKWLFETALTRAKLFDIPGVTYRKTQGVVKNIIPAIASTNAIVAAACANEAFKLCTNSAMLLADYMMINGSQGVYSHTYEQQRKDNCPVCMNASIPVEMSVGYTEATLQHVLNAIDESKAKPKAPALATVEGKNLFSSRGPLAASTAGNLAKLLMDLDIAPDDSLVLSDPTLPSPAVLALVFKE